MMFTPTDVTAALQRIANVADPEDVNMVRAELARLLRLSDASIKDDFKFALETRLVLDNWHTPTTHRVNNMTGFDNAGVVPQDNETWTR